MAKAAGISVSSVQRIWRAHGLRPHLVRRFKLSNDPQFAAKLKEIVGLYINPPNHAIVLSVDEKSQIQALDRTQPGLPMKKGRAGTITHDYKRHGITTLFAALDVLEGKVIGQCMKRHRHQEFIRFLNVIDARVAKKKTVHVIVDNYAAHKHPKVLEWIENHPRFVFHFTPTSASWLNAVESFFAKLTKKRLKRGVFRSLQELKDAIHRFLDDTNANLRPEVAERVVALTLAGPPPTASHWTGAAMAKAAGISVSSVQRIWRAHGLRPHLVRRFKLSNDPQFAAKLKEIVGLYAVRPIFGPLAVRFFRLAHDAGLAAPS
jgi:transposase